eukprot:768439-Hanusia_phi.AAC.3
MRYKEEGCTEGGRAGGRRWSVGLERDEDQRKEEHAEGRGLEEEGEEGEHVWMRSRRMWFGRRREGEFATLTRAGAGDYAEPELQFAPSPSLSSFRLRLRILLAIGALTRIHPSHVLLPPCPPPDSFLLRLRTHSRAGGGAEGTRLEAAAARGPGEQDERDGVGVSAGRQCGSEGQGRDVGAEERGGDGRAQGSAQGGDPLRSFLVVDHSVAHCSAPAGGEDGGSRGETAVPPSRSVAPALRVSHRHRRPPQDALRSLRPPADAREPAGEGADAGGGEDGGHGGGGGDVPWRALQNLRGSDAGGGVLPPRGGADASPQDHGHARVRGGGEVRPAALLPPPRLATRPDPADRSWVPRIRGDERREKGEGGGGGGGEVVPGHLVGGSGGSEDEDRGAGGGAGGDSEEGVCDEEAAGGGDE